MDNGASSYRRFLAGDEEGLAEIIRDYKDGLILYLNGFTQNILIAEELMEETFVKLVVKRPKFREKYSFKTWLYTIGRNTAIDYLRKNAKVCALTEEIRSQEEDLERSYIQKEQKIALHRALSRLKPEYRQVLYLAYFEGFNNQQTAAVMKRSRRQIENLTYRAKQALRSELERKGFVYEEL